MNGEQNPKPITFYELKFYMFSNFSSFAVEFDGRLWPTSEHAYQGFKFDDYPTQERIRAERSAHSAMKLAQSMESQYRADWATSKLVWMEQICRSKLQQHQYIQRKLVETGDRELIESSPIDSFWGWGPNKDGQNHLGKIWMKLRDEWNTRAPATAEQVTPQAPQYRDLQVGEVIQAGDEVRTYYGHEWTQVRTTIGEEMKKAHAGFFRRPLSVSPTTPEQISANQERTGEIPCATKNAPVAVPKSDSTEERTTQSAPSSSNAASEVRPSLSGKSLEEVARDAADAWFRTSNHPLEEFILTALRTVVAEQDEDVDVWKQSADRHREEHAALSDQLTSLRSQLAALEEDRAMLKANLANADEKIVELQDFIRTAKPTPS